MLQLTANMLLLAWHLHDFGHSTRFDRCAAKGLVARGLATFSDDQKSLRVTGSTSRLMRGETAFKLLLNSTNNALNDEAERIAQNLRLTGNWPLEIARPS